jgi:hypothetical protein
VASVARWLERKYGEQSFTDELSSREALLAACYAASIRNGATFGEHGPILRLGHSASGPI